MPGVTHGLVVQCIYLTFKCFTHGSKPTRCTKSLKLFSTNVNFFKSIKRRNHFTDSIMNYLTVIDVLIYHTSWRPSE